MNAKKAMLQRLTTARKRIRDAAAGAAERAIDARGRAEAAEQAARAELESLLSDFRGASHVNALLMFDHERSHATGAIEGAAVETRARRDEAERMQAALAHRSRELKTSERARDLVRAELEAMEKRFEQRAADDLSGTRRRRS